MNAPSTQNLPSLAGPKKIQGLCQSISALEAILMPDWQYRYYSYNRKWTEAEEFCGMRNGSGDEVLMLFSKHGTVINGFAHESSMNGWKKVAKEEKKSFVQKVLGDKSEQENELVQNIWKGVLDTLPDAFSSFIFGEPVKSIGTTFCIWATTSNPSWTIGDIVFPADEFADGSAGLLELLDGRPETYHTWGNGTGKPWYSSRNIYRYGDRCKWMYGYGYDYLG